MTAYMLRDNSTGLYYHRSDGYCGPSWQPQDRGSIWTAEGGAKAAFAYCRKYAQRAKRPDTFQIVGFTLSEIKP